MTFTFNNKNLPSILEKDYFENVEKIYVTTKDYTFWEDERPVRYDFVQEPFEICSIYWENLNKEDKSVTFILSNGKVDIRIDVDSTEGGIVDNKWHMLLICPIELKFSYKKENE